MKRAILDSVLRTANWVIRAAGFVVIGVVTFTARHGDSARFDMEIAAFALAGLVLVFWASRDLPDPERTRSAPWLPFALGAMTVAGASASATGTGGALIFLAFMAVLSAGSETSLTSGFTVFGLGVLSVEIGALAYGSSSWTVFGYPLVLLVALLLGHNRRSYRVKAEQSAAMLAQVEQLRIEQHRIDVLDERTRIAREIHDVLAHSLGALSLQIQSARAVLSVNDDRPRTLELLDQAQRMASEGLTETRRAIHALRTDTPPLPDVLAELAGAHELLHQAPVTFHVNGEPRVLTPDASLALTRTAQETLVNSAKHAPREPVDLSLDFDDDHTVLTASNRLSGPGDTTMPGFESVNGGYGLTGMRERLLLLGGTLSAGPDHDRWIVTAQVPG
jgi:signal transduction histidine kinase